MSILVENQATIAALADRTCKSPRKRLALIRRVALGERASAASRLATAAALLDELAREDMAQQVRPAWRKATRLLARETARRRRA